MNLKSRAIAVCLGVAIACTSLPVAALVILSAEGSVNANLVGYGLGVGLISGFPLGAPLGVIGGLIAAGFVERRPRGQSRGRWIVPGALWGAALAGLGGLAYGLFGGAGGDSLKTAVFYATGGVVGGGVMGLWCLRNSTPE